MEHKIKLTAGWGERTPSALKNIFAVNIDIIEAEANCQCELIKAAVREETAKEIAQMSKDWSNLDIVSFEKKYSINIDSMPNPFHHPTLSAIIEAKYLPSKGKE
jgi:hypothetical protein